MTQRGLLPRFVIYQHAQWKHQEIVREKLGNRQDLPTLAPFKITGEIGTWHDIPVACIDGDPKETRLIPILEQNSVEYVFSIGFAGSLSRNLQRGNLVSPTASVRGDGLTDSWADLKMPAVAETGALLAINESARLAGIQISNGIFFTTQSVYREMEIIESWAKLGIVAIQMEIAQYLLLPHLYGKKATGLYVISDLPIQGEEIWRTGLQMDDVLISAYHKSADIVLGAIRLLSGRG